MHRRDYAPQKNKKTTKTEERIIEEVY